MKSSWVFFILVLKQTGCAWPPSYFSLGFFVFVELLPSKSASSAYSDLFVEIPKPLNSTATAFVFQASSHQSNLQPSYMFNENPALLQEAGDVLLGAGRPCEG